jgi:hypothetical protein
VGTELDLSTAFSRGTEIVWELDGGARALVSTILETTESYLLAVTPIDGVLLALLPENAPVTIRLDVDNETHFLASHVVGWEMFDGRHTTRLHRPTDAVGAVRRRHPRAQIDCKAEFIVPGDGASEATAIEGRVIDLSLGGALGATAVRIVPAASVTVRFTYILPDGPFAFSAHATVLRDYAKVNLVDEKLYHYSNLQFIDLPADELDRLTHLVTTIEEISKQRRRDFALQKLGGRK